MIRWAQHTLVSLRPNPSSGVCDSQPASWLPLFRSLHSLIKCQSLNTWYRQVLETRGEAERSTGRRDRDEVVREAFLEVAVLELKLKIRKWPLSSMKGRESGWADCFSIWWPSEMFMSFPAKASWGLSLGQEEKTKQAAPYLWWGLETQEVQSQHALSLFLIE